MEKQTIADFIRLCKLGSKYFVDILSEDFFRTKAHKWYSQAFVQNMSANMQYLFYFWFHNIQVFACRDVELSCSSSLLFHQHITWKAMTMSNKKDKTLNKECRSIWKTSLLAKHNLDCSPKKLVPYSINLL